MIKSKSADLEKEFKNHTESLQEKIDKFHEGKIRETHLKDWMTKEYDYIKDIL